MENIRFIGMNEIKKEMLNLIKYEDVYKKSNAKIPHFAIMLDSGNGQTYITEVVTDVLVNHELREFHGIDEYLEYKTDGTLSNLKLMFSDIDDNAIYDNAYKGVVAIDVSKIAGVQNEYQMKYLEEQLKKVSETATIVLYYATTLGKRGETLIRRLCDVIGNVRIIKHEEYTAHELAEMVVQNILERGIVVSDEDKVVKVLSEVVAQSEIKSAKAAVMMAEKLVFYADYSKPIPVLNFGEEKDFKNNFCKEA